MKEDSVEGYKLYNSDDMTPEKDAAKDAEKIDGCLGPRGGERAE